MSNMLALREYTFFNYRSNIPISSEELPDTNLGNLLYVIRNCENNNLNNAPKDENGDIREDVLESHFILLNNIYALFIVNLWSITEQFLTKNKRLFINLQHERNSEPTENINTVKYGGDFKRWFKQNFGIEISTLKNEKTADLVRILCNNFKHNGQLNQIIPADLDPFSGEAYINKGIKELKKDHISTLCNYFSEKKNPSYFDLNIEYLMYDLGTFCNDFHSKITEKYKNNNGL